MFANIAWDRYGAEYDVSRILINDTFNLEAYQNYSPLYLSAGYSMTYFISFALATCILVHTALYHGSSLINGLKRVKVEPDDIHAKLMRNYPEVPDWWYMLFLGAFFGFAILANEVRGCPSFCLSVQIKYINIDGLVVGCRSGTRAFPSGHSSCLFHFPPSTCFRRALSTQ